MALYQVPVNQTLEGKADANREIHVKKYLLKQKAKYTLFMNLN